MRTITRAPAVFTVAGIEMGVGAAGPDKGTYSISPSSRLGA
jgi:hypothetical protein